MVNVDVNIYIYLYKYRRGLGRHVRKNHTAHPVFSCNQCERSFARSNNLEKHKLLLLQLLLKNVAFVLPLSSICERLVNHLEML